MCSFFVLQLPRTAQSVERKSPIQNKEISSSDESILNVSEYHNLNEKQINEQPEDNISSHQSPVDDTDNDPDFVPDKLSLDSSEENSTGNSQVNF